MLTFVSQKFWLAIYSLAYLAVFNSMLAYETLVAEQVSLLALDIISYQDLQSSDPTAITTLQKALYEKGIVGLKSVPGYMEKVQNLITTSREFAALPETVKETYAPDPLKGGYLGYEIGKEMFRLQGESWLPDTLKASYYAVVPDSSDNKWPKECDLQTPFQAMGQLMFETAQLVMQAVHLVGPAGFIPSSDLSGVGRLLHYHKCSDANDGNPLWCGAHYDHGMFTALLPSFYFSQGEPVPEPIEAGLFVRPYGSDTFYKVLCDQPDVMLFQVGEFSQLASHDAIKATEHRVHKPQQRTDIERFTMALFITPPMETTLYSLSELAQDNRYGNDKACTFAQWHTNSLQRYHFKP